MTGTSKYLNKQYGDYIVVDYFLVNTYKGAYGQDVNNKEHRAYSYILKNIKTNDTLTLSGNQLRLFESGKRSIDQLFDNVKGGYKNLEVGKIKKELYK